MLSDVSAGGNVDATSDSEMPRDDLGQSDELDEDDYLDEFEASDGVAWIRDELNSADEDDTVSAPPPTLTLTLTLHAGRRHLLFAPNFSRCRVGQLEQWDSDPAHDGEPPSAGERHNVNPLPQAGSAGGWLCQRSR